MEDGEYLYGGPCNCEQGQQRRKEAEEEYRTMLWATAAVPSRFWHWTLDSCPVDEAVKARLRRPEGEEQRESWNRQSWLLWGRHGVGKTGLAVGYLRQRADQLRAVRFVTLPDLLSQIRDTYGTDGRTEMGVVQYYRDVPILVIDDMGAEHVKDREWLSEKLYQIVGGRHDNLLPTMFTSNLSPEELGKRIGERTMWRLMEACAPDGIVELRGPNLRTA